MSNLSSANLQFKKTKSSLSTIESLPIDLLIDVLTQAASSSFTDLFNAKLSCKRFLKASKDKSIMKNISIEKFPVVPWWEAKDEETLFLKVCKENGNPEVLYRQGMMEFFGLNKMESGEHDLKTATEMGHMEASYVYDIILMCRKGELNKGRGVRLLNAVKKSRKLVQCKKRTKAFILKMWIRNPIKKYQELSNCHAETCIEGTNEGVGGGRRRRGWLRLEDEDDNEDYCEGCMWDDEVTLFCKLFK